MDHGSCDASAAANPPAEEDVESQRCAGVKRDFIPRPDGLEALT